MDEEHSKQRKKYNSVDNKQGNITKDLSSASTTAELLIQPEFIQSTSMSSTPLPSSSSVSSVTQTKEEYFDALRQWLQQVQMQQTALAYFPYYLASNYQQMTNNGVGGPSQQYQSSVAFYSPSQYSMFPRIDHNFGATPATTASAQQTNQTQIQSPQQPVVQQPPQPPIFLSNIFQPNRNYFIDNARRNTEGGTNSDYYLLCIVGLIFFCFVFVLQLFNRMVDTDTSMLLLQFGNALLLKQLMCLFCLL